MEAPPIQERQELRVSQELREFKDLPSGQVPQDHRESQEHKDLQV
jgi:hypothetical protein